MNNDTENHHFDRLFLLGKMYGWRVGILSGVIIGIILGIVASIMIGHHCWYLFARR